MLRMRCVYQLMNCTTEIARRCSQHMLQVEKVTAEPLSDIDEWIKEISAKWDKRLQRLKTLLENKAEGS